MPGMATTPASLRMERAAVHIPAVLRAYKEARQMSDEGIADQLGMSRSAVQARMAGDTKCSAAELVGFAYVFQTTANDIAEGRIVEPLDPPDLGNPDSAWMMSTLETV